MKIFILFMWFLVVGCLQAEKRKALQLDTAAVELQRQAFWHREYYFRILKFTNLKQLDSVYYYERKMDSVLLLYAIQVRFYDSLTKTQLP